MSIRREIRATVDLGEDLPNEAQHIKDVVESALAQLALSFDVRVDLVETVRGNAPIVSDDLEVERIRVVH